MDDVTLNLAEVIGYSLLKEKIEKNKVINAYWGTAPTGEPHLGYLVPMIKIRDMVQAGWNVTILLADVHSFMDNGVTDYSRVENKTAYYEFIITCMLNIVGLDNKEFTMVKGSSYQFDKNYCTDLFKFTSMIGIRDAQKAGSEVVKSSKNPRLSTLIYPLMQVLDEKMLTADVQLGGLDQRKIFMLSWDWVEKLGQQKCTYFMNPIIPSLTFGKIFMQERKKLINELKKNGANIDEKKIDEQLKNILKKQNKMSASDPNGKISFIDSDLDIKRKLNKAFCIDGNDRLDLNAILSILKYIILPLSKEFVVTRDEKYGGDKIYNNFVQIMNDWKSEILVGADLKPSVMREIIKVVSLIRQKIQNNSILRKQAYG